MGSVEEISKKIQATGFRCIRCGRCCRCLDKDSNLVMVFPQEIRSLMRASGLAYDTVAELYPAMIDGPCGSRFPLGWCLRRHEDYCRFFIEGSCMVYDDPP